MKARAENDVLLDMYDDNIDKLRTRKMVLQDLLEEIQGQLDHYYVRKAQRVCELNAVPSGEHLCLRVPPDDGESSES